MAQTLKERLQHNGALANLAKGIEFIEEETEIAKRGEFTTQTDVDYLSHGLELVKKFKEELDTIIRLEIF